MAKGGHQHPLSGECGLRLGPGARPLLRGEQRLELRHEAVRKAPAAAKTRRAVTFEDADQEALFQALRAKRLALAKAQGVPPYVIFHDATLAEMARARPSVLPQLAVISGVGEAKLDRYGEAFLAVIAGQG